MFAAILLGLNISKSLIGLHGGRIGYCTPEDGIGSEFWFDIELPIQLRPVKCHSPLAPRRSLTFSAGVIPPPTTNTTNNAINNSAMDDTYQSTPHYNHRKIFSFPAIHNDSSQNNKLHPQPQHVRSHSSHNQNTTPTINSINESRSVAMNILPPCILSDSSITHPATDPLHNRKLSTKAIVAITTKSPRNMATQEFSSDENNSTPSLPPSPNPPLEQSLFSPADTTPSPPSRPRILVAEDSAPNRKLLLMLLKRLEYECVGVENGQLAVDEFIHAAGTENSVPYDLILMDGTMPVKDGITATKELRAMGITIPILAVTGNAMSEDVAQFLSAGAQQVLSKPVNAQVLQKTLQDWLKR